MKLLLLRSYDNLPLFIFYIFLFFLPQQFGPHFWPFFSLVNGIRVDYLSPAIYISDIMLITLFFLSYKKVFRNKKIISFLKNEMFIIFVLLIVLSTFFSKSPLSSFFGIIKILEFTFLGLFVFNSYNKPFIENVSKIFVLGAVFESGLSILQFLNKGSLNSIFYFLGERFYTASSLSTAQFEYNGNIFVRPYGTFPHPNVLSFFLFISLMFGMYLFLKSKSVYLLIALLIIQFGILLTFTRTVILLNICFLIFYFLNNVKINNYKLFKFFGVVFLFLFTLFIFIFNSRFLNFSNLLKDINSRNELTTISITAIINKPLGVGINNHFLYEQEFQKNFTSVYLQPVHNIFLLIAMQVGILGFLIFVYFLGVAVVKVKRVTQKPYFNLINVYILVMLISIIIAGLFDHYFLSIQQGQFLLAIILGIGWGIVSNNSKN